MSDEELSNADFTKQKQAIELLLPTDNSNQMKDLANALQEMRSLIAQFKQQSSRPIQAGTSWNDNNTDFRKKSYPENKGLPKVNGQERTKDHNDNDISIHASGDEIEDNNGNKNE